MKEFFHLFMNNADWFIGSTIVLALLVLFCIAWHLEGRK